MPGNPASYNTVEIWVRTQTPAHRNGEVKMSRIVLFLGILAVMATAALTVPTQAANSSDPSMSGERSPGSSSMSPGMSSSSGTRMSDTSSADAQKYFQDARSSFDSKDFTTCATDLRKGADILRSNAANAKMMTAHDLRSTARDLEKLADRVQRGDVKSVDDLNSQIGDAYKALSTFHYQQAKASYDRNRKAGTPAGRDVETGSNLNAAANDLENWAQVTGRTIKSDTQAAISETKELASKMMEGTGWATEKAGVAINNFGDTIKNFGRNLEQRNNNNKPTSPIPPGGESSGPGSAGSTGSTRY